MTHRFRKLIAVVPQPPCGCRSRQGRQQPQQGQAHDHELIRQQRLTRADWNREIDKMVGWAARMTDEDRVGVLDHLLGNFEFGLRTTASEASQSIDTQG